MIYFTPENFDKAVLLLAEKLKGKYSAIYGVPKGGCLLAYRLSQLLGLPLLTQQPPVKKSVLIVDDLVDSGSVRKKFAAFDFASIHIKSHTPDKFIPEYYIEEVNDWVHYWWEGHEEESSIEENFTRFLQFVGEDPAREGLVETPKRMAKAWKFWTSGYEQDPKSVFKEFEDGGENYDEMILVSPIPFYSHCEHHMAAIFGNVHIAYIPNKKIAGLSKFARLTDIFSRRLQVQERLTTQIAETIQNELKPLGVAVMVEGRHFCMESRGVQKPGVMTKTSALKGAFKDNPETRAEFFNLIKH